MLASVVAPMHEGEPADALDTEPGLTREPALRLLLFADPDFASQHAHAARDPAGGLRTRRHRSCRGDRCRHRAALARSACERARELGDPEHVQPADRHRPCSATAALQLSIDRAPIANAGSRAGQRSVNDPSFVEAVRSIAPDASLALMVGQIFRAPLLDACRRPINFHDGLLPNYRGVAATGWSIYHGESESGFTFHRMVERVDRGPIVVQGLVQVAADEDCAQVEFAKTQQARHQLDDLFDRLAAGDGEIEQSDAGSSFSRAELRAIRTVEQPQALDRGGAAPACAFVWVDRPEPARSDLAHDGAAARRSTPGRSPAGVHDGRWSLARATAREGSSAGRLSFARERRAPLQGAPSGRGRDLSRSRSAAQAETTGRVSARTKSSSWPVVQHSKAVQYCS